MSGVPAILVTDAGRPSAVTIIRSLGRRGWRVVAADHNPRSIGFLSRYAHEHLVYPDPAIAPDAFIETLHKEVGERRIDLVFPVTDEVIHPLSRARGRFESECRLALPSEEALEVVTDKAKSLSLVDRLGVPAPRTQVVTTREEARRAAGELEWPVVLKPAVSRLYRPEAGAIEAFSVTYAENIDSLMEAMLPFCGRCPVLLQEYCPGVGEGVEMLAHQGRVLAAFQHRRLAEVPLTGGRSAWRESAPLCPTLYAHASRVVEAISWTGLIMVEFKVGDAPRLMEINGRVWNSLPLAVHSGVDFPARLVDLYFAERPPEEKEPFSDYRIGMRTFHLEFILNWMFRLFLDRKRYPYLPIPKRSRALAAGVGLLSPWQRMDLTAWDDVRPMAAEWLKVLRKLPGKLRAGGDKPRRTVKADVHGA